MYDIAIHPNFVSTLKAEPAFMNFFLQVIYEGLAAKFTVSVEDNSFTIYIIYNAQSVLS